MTALLKRGRCHVFGDDIPHDEGIMAFKYAIERVNDPDKLIPHLFESVDPGFAKRVKPGDIVLAGRNFGHGHPHAQGLIAMAALDIGIVCASMPYKMHRRAVAKGVPVIVGAPDLSQFAATGDEVEIDFASGAARNLSRGSTVALPAMPAILLDIVCKGGMEGLLVSWLAEHPEQAAANCGAPTGHDLASIPVSVVQGKR